MGLSQSTLSYFCDIYHSPVGPIGVVVDEQFLRRIHFLIHPPAQPITPSRKAPALATELFDLTITQLQEYFAGKRQQFALPLLLEGTPLQNKICQHLPSIPFGQQATYATVAATLGTHPRVIGNACGKNPLPIVLPCHRVVSQQGLGGFMGQTEGSPITIKRKLIELEKSFS